MAKPDLSADTTARLMLVLLSLGWGTTWPMMRIVLDEVPPFSMRVATMVIGAVTLARADDALRRRSFALHSRVAAAHVVVAGLFNIVSFSILTPFAQLYAATSRVSIVVYSMPIWATLMARIFLGERITGMRAVAFALCVAGLVVLVWPLAVAGIPAGILLALGAAMGWAAGTIYLKWAQIREEPMAVTFWQLDRRVRRRRDLPAAVRRPAASLADPRDHARRAACSPGWSAPASPISSGSRWCAGSRR